MISHSVDKDSCSILLENRVKYRLVEIREILCESHDRLVMCESLCIKIAHLIHQFVVVIRELVHDAYSAEYGRMMLMLYLYCYPMLLY